MTETKPLSFAQLSEAADTLYPKPLAPTVIGTVLDVCEALGIPVDENAAAIIRTIGLIRETEPVPVKSRKGWF